MTLYLSATLGTVLALGGALILVDPFSTGRLTPFDRTDVAAKNAMLGHAARVRNPQFDAAILGNSHGLPLDPQRVGKATGLRFAQLSAPGLYPAEVLVLARAFQRNHPAARAFVVVLDDLNCESHPRFIREWGVFPTFLFEGSDWDYVRQLLFPGSVEAAARKLGILLGLAGSPGRPDGFNPLMFPPANRPARLARIAEHRRPTEPPAPFETPPALVLMQSFAAGLASETALVLYFTPIPATLLPAPGSAAQHWLDSCKSCYRAIADSHPRTAFIDRRVEDGFTREISNFEDIQHIRNELAPILEEPIVAALRSLK